MPLVSCEMSATIKVGDPFGNNYAKITYAIRDIDTAIDISKQLIESKNAMTALSQVVQDKIDTKIDELLPEK